MITKTYKSVDVFRMDVHSTVLLKPFLGEVQNVTYIPAEVKMSKQPTGTSRYC